MNKNCLFCKIIAGEIPCSRVYEEENVLVFMDIGPIVKGHALVIPKEHYETMTDTPDEVLADLIRVAKRIAKAQQDGLQTDGCNIIQNNGTAAGQAVPHIHIHVIPRFADDKHHWNWDAKEYEDEDELREMTKTLSSAVL